MAMLFERFISKERNEPPDIDVDFEHERREEVIQYIYGKYGRERAALAATVICYRPRSALRDVGKALGLDLAQVDKLARGMQWWDGQRIDPDRIRASGFDPEDPVIARLIALAAEILGFPRHLSQHVGGFVIARGRLDELVPIENAAMPDRTVIEWDKDDLDALGLLKVDVLGLGMLSALRRTFQMVNEFGGSSAAAGQLGLATVPGEDPAVYEMICRADTTGVFQIESRAQMSMLPRLRPQNYYDLVIEVAIVRPGPIQGEMVHPYLRRRSGEEAVTYPSKEVEAVLKRTLGVPIFQEQVMQLAIVAAGFSPGEADRLRRAMAAWKRKGGLEPFQRQLIDGMRERGYPEASRIRYSIRYWDSANTAFPSRMRRASRSSSTPPPGSNTTNLRHFARPSSPASRWAFMRRPNWCATRAPTGSRCAPSMRHPAIGTARASGGTMAALHCAWGCVWSSICRARERRGCSRRGRYVHSTPSRIWPSGAALPGTICRLWRMPMR